MKNSYVKIVIILCAVFADLANADYGDWHAQVIDIGDSPTALYINEKSEESLYDSMDFNEGDFEGVAAKKSVETMSVAGGRLTFRVVKDVELVWGDINSNEPGRRRGFLGENWGDQSWPWVVQVKIRQSRQKSKWALEAEYLQHGHRRAVKSEVVLTGKNEQIVQFNMGAAKREYYGFRLSSDTPNNDVSIDWIKAVRPSIKKVFRYKFNIQDVPVTSKILFSANGKTTVFLNGVKLGSHGASHPYSRMLNIYKDVQEIIRGDNELCVTVEGYSAHSTVKNPGGQFFFLEGAVIDVNGNAVELITDRSWQGAYSDEGCSNLNVALKDVTMLGGVKKAWPVLTGMQPHERFGERPYLGRIKLEYASGDKPVFSERRDVVLKVDVIGSSPTSEDNHYIKYQLIKWSDDKRRDEKTLIDGVVSQSNGIINLQKLASGVYEILLTYHKNGKIIDELRQELAVTGKINQDFVNGDTYTQGMQLKKIDHVKFDSKMKRKILCGSSSGKDSDYLKEASGIIPVVKGLVDANLGEDGLELSSQRADWCSVEFNTGQLYKPHLVEVEYPDDGARSMLFVVAEDSRFPNIHNIGRGGGIPRLTTGVFTKGQGLANTAVKRFIYWPNKTDATLTIVNSGRKFIDRGAIKSLTIYEIESGLPAFTMPLQDGSNPFIGPFVERIDRTTPRLFYGGSLEAKFSHDLMRWGNFSGYYNAWYSTISNLIEYMRFSGQNTYYAGIYMYSGGWFASEKYQGHSESGVDYFATGWSDGALDLMAKMFEENGLNIVLGVQFIGSRNLSEIDRVSDAEVIDGVESVRFIDNNGRQVHGFQDQGYNFLSTDVRDEILGLAGEIGVKFSKYNSVKGITWMRQPEIPLAPIVTLGKTPLDIGYGDLTISLYKQQTDTLLPTSSDYRNRFNHRYQWIKKHEIDKWLQWRCQKVFELDSKIKDIFSSYRSDWKLWRIVPRPVPELIEKWGAGEIDVVDAYRHAGTDPVLYAKSDQLNLMFINDIGGEKQYELRHRLESLTNEVSKFYDEIGGNDDLKDFDMFAHIGFILETQLQAGKKWPWRRLNVVGYSVPSVEGVYSKLSQFKANQGRKAIAIGWSDVGHFTGFEQDVRNYWREFRLH